METQKIQIEVNGRPIDFYFTPAETENKPLLVIYHGHGYTQIPSAFKSPSYNVVCPMDHFGYDGLGSWYLGENGDFFWVNAMREILKYVQDTCVSLSFLLLRLILGRNPRKTLNKYNNTNP
jgi:hypothetical protein